MNHFLQKNKFVVMFVMALFSLSILVAGCGGTTDQKVADNKKVVIGLSISTLNNPFFVDLRDGAQEAAKAQGAELMVEDAQNDAGKQLANIENMIQQKVSLIIVNPVDSKAIVPAIEAANKAGIKVITVDRGADGGQVVAAIASDNVAGGNMAAKYMLEKLGNKGKIVELEGIPGTSAANDRGKGFHEGLKGAADVTVVAKQPADFDRAKGLKVMENILQANPDIQAVFAHNDEMALGALEAIKAANKTGIFVIGFDATADAVKAVKDGSLLATVAQKPKDMGKVAVETALKVLKGETVPASIPVGLDLIK
ncbi:ribose transport system substrate-binding protein [Sporomusaceae bacterium BoRhaA]|uniref:ribose ABC transporter substrate-binding protein RbsB n=1 Tax=Pelorhabdus rhamnosifermentans TaxID=2772457 RepID=UPI001C05F741|nr:ribose ABC transporter substrate-binding protein RbsB [Pelorhabdus rhamnosifermentans]MBU2702225.1 ribose transport system substrate-binding protein [Pelorhabdus rhamnosifermentans]